jgi:hypothetical protein
LQTKKDAGPLKYCPKCRREYADSDLSCPEHGLLDAAELQSSFECELCGKPVARGQKACTACGASVRIEGWVSEPIGRPSQTKPEKEIAAPRRYNFSDHETRGGEEKPFHFNDPRPERAKARNTGLVLTVGGVIACAALGGILIGERYGIKPATVTPVPEQASPAPRLENPLPLEAPGAKIQTLADKPAESATDKSRETETLTERAPNPTGKDGSVTKNTQRSAVGSNENSDEKRQGFERSAPVSLKIPNGVRIPSPVEVRRKRAQLESEQATTKHAIPDGVEIPSALEIRRKRIEYEVDQAIQNRAIQGVSVAFIGTTVYLTGQVETERQRAAAEQAARAVPEVGSIRSSISVRDTRG